MSQGHSYGKGAWVGLWVGRGRVSGDLQGWSNSVSQVDGILDMAAVCWLSGGWPRKGTMASACLDARYLSLPLQATGAPQAATLSPEPRRSESEQVSPCVGSLRGTAWGSRSFFHWFNPCWFLQSEVVGTYFPGTGTLGWGAWCGSGTPRSQGTLPEFLSTSHWCGTSPFFTSTLPTNLGWCCFFNSVVVRLPFNLISVSSEQRLFYIFVVILFWLCEEMSHVCLHHHLDGSEFKWYWTESYCSYVFSSNERNICETKHVFKYRQNHKS